MRCGHVHEKACCPHPRARHWHETILEGHPEAAYGECADCAEVEERFIEREERGEVPPDGVTYIAPDHRYRAAVKCGRPERAPLYPDEPHERIYGHAFLGVPELVEA